MGEAEAGKVDVQWLFRRLVSQLKHNEGFVQIYTRHPLEGIRTMSHACSKLGNVKFQRGVMSIRSFKMLDEATSAITSSAFHRL